MRTRSVAEPRVNHIRLVGADRRRPGPVPAWGPEEDRDRWVLDRSDGGWQA